MAIPEGTLDDSPPVEQPFKRQRSNEPEPELMNTPAASRAVSGADETHPEAASSTWFQKIPDNIYIVNEPTGQQEFTIEKSL